MNKLVKEQVKKIITRRFEKDYIYTIDVSEYFGFVEGISFILELLGYENDLDKIYYEFERFANEQKFLAKNTNKFTKKDVEDYANMFFDSEPNSQ